MKIAATNPPTSPTMPPPKAISSEPRSPPAGHHLAQQLLHAGHGLVLFAGGQKQRQSAARQRKRESLAPERPDLRRGEHKDPPRQPAGQRARCAAPASRSGRCPPSRRTWPKVCLLVWFARCFYRKARAAVRAPSPPPSVPMTAPLASAHRSSGCIPPPRPCSRP